MALQSKITVYVALVGVFAMLGGIIYYASLGNSDLEQVEIELQIFKIIENGPNNFSAKGKITTQNTWTVSEKEF